MIEKEVINKKKFVGQMQLIGEKFTEYLKKELKKREIPINGNHIGFFIILADFNNKLEFKEIAEIARKSKSSLCDIVDRYEDQGLAQREHSSANKKTVYVKLTSEGLKYSREIKEITDQYFDKITRNLNEKQIKEIEGILDIMHRSL